MATTGYLLDQSNKLRGGNESEANDMFAAAEEHPLLPRTSRQLFLHFANLDWCVK